MKLTYSVLDQPFIASAIIGAGMFGTTYLGCYFMRTDPQNSFYAAVFAGLAVWTVVSIPLVITRHWLLLKTLPWADKPTKYLVKPDRIVFEPHLPDLGRYDIAMQVMPSMFEDWPIRAELVPKTIQILLQDPYRATYRALDHLSRGDVDKVQKFMLEKRIGYRTAKTVELTYGGKRNLNRVMLLTR
jgi:hypothetical protein